MIPSPLVALKLAAFALAVPFGIVAILAWKLKGRP